MTLLVAVKVYDLPVPARIRSAQTSWIFVVAMKLLTVDEVHATDRAAPVPMQRPGRSLAQTPAHVRDQPKEERSAEQGGDHA